MTIPEDYRKETDSLIRAILNAATLGKKIVLATPVSFDEHGHYRQDSDIYQPYGLCNRASGNALSETAGTREATEAIRNITCGHIALSNDPLIIPVQLSIANGGHLDSFSLAIARASRPELINNLVQRVGSEVRYSNYMSNEKFHLFNALFSARAILQESVDKQQLEARAVIIGGSWSTFASGRGPAVDLHRTPVGPIVGAMLHANFVEAFLDSRTFRSAPEWVLQSSEIAFSLIAAVTFVFIRTFWGKIAAVPPLVLSLLLVQWAALHGFGVFFDPFVPLLGLGLHSLYERLVGFQQVTRGATPD